ncbi:cation:dicarboxylate symporter family transporter [uncultured Rossellomorea sp.]|nr:cation:dicarboxylase symporter family transporter [uncultured Rossellomorea sp.]
MHPLNFIKGIAPAGLIAFTTVSSSATLPVAIRNTREKT